MHVVGVKVTGDEKCENDGCSQTAEVIVERGHKDPGKALCTDCIPPELLSQRLFDEIAWWKTA